MGKHTDPRSSYIATATARFAREGYHGASLAAIARDAGVTKQAFLHFFGTKEALYAEVLTDLATRLMADIEAARDPDPVQHLLTYFQTFRASSMSKGEDIRLVVRALLDSSEDAQKWPLKGYIDRLIEIAEQTQDPSSTRTETLAWVSQMIGMIQYLAISKPTVTGMYGKDTARSVSEQFEALIKDAVHRFAAPAHPKTPLS